MSRQGQVEKRNVSAARTSHLTNNDLLTHFGYSNTSLPVALRNISIVLGCIVSCSVHSENGVGC